MSNNSENNILASTSSKTPITINHENTSFVSQHKMVDKNSKDATASSEANQLD